MRKYLLIASVFLMMAFQANGQTNVAYQDSKVRFSIVSDGVVRMEYSPTGEFVDEKSFVAVERNYPKVKYKVRKGDWVEISTSKMHIKYKKDSGAFTADNLQIQSAASITPSFVWTPGMKQRENLKGTTRTLDMCNGDYNYRYNKKLELEDGLLARDGWTLIDDSGSFLFDGDTENWDWVKQRNAKDNQDWYFMAYGNDYMTALKDYTLFAGKMPLPPRFAFGYWWSRYWMYSDYELRQLCKNFKQWNIPLDVLVIDMDWHYTNEGKGGWTGWTWNKELFPDYAGLLKDIKSEYGHRVTLNLHPADGVKHFEEKYADVAKALGVSPESKQDIPWVVSDKKMIGAVFDNILNPMSDNGVDFWWLDWQQDLYDKKLEGLSNTWWINYVFFSQMERERTTRPLIYHRWGGLGNHRYQIGFSGDTQISWQSLAFQPYFNATASNVLYGYWSHDIGGHHDAPGIMPEMYVRWMQFGVFSPILRTHSTKSAVLNKEPWVFDNEVSSMLRDIVRMRYDMVPYIYTYARKAYEEGVALCRPLYYHYPNDQRAYDLRTQYMFGDDIMVAAIVSPAVEGYNEVEVWLPAGNDWYEFATGTWLKGGQVVKRSFALDEYPIYMKSGAVIPMYTDEVMNLNGVDEAIELNIAPGEGEYQFTLYEDNGNDQDYATRYATTQILSSRDKSSLKVEIKPREGDYAGMSDERRFMVKVLCSGMPSEVLVNGKKADYKYLSDEFALLVELDETLCKRAKTVEVHYADNTIQPQGLLGQNHRINKALEKLKFRHSGIIFCPELAKMGSLNAALRYTPSEADALLSEYMETYKALPQILKEKQYLSDDDTRWFLQLINHESLSNN